ncbi:MAG: hypothetical protein WAQ08_10905 [Aquabacterium sp.]|uniref:hypothetical protein n=1 Tax=Aquabacterium sp. TaxID=1872578 RepID=UPI003BAF27BE
MAKMKICAVRLLFIVSVVAMIGGSRAAPADYVKTRQSAAVARLGDYDRSRSTLGPDTFLLFSLKRTVPGTRLVSIIESSGAHATGVYLCSSTGGVLALYLASNRGFREQLKEASEGGNADAMIGAQAANSGTPGLGAQPTVAPDAYCGLEVQGTWKALMSIRKSLASETFLIEVTDRRMRMLPIGLDLQPKK